jgi:hypothetical protein
VEMRPDAVEDGADALKNALAEAEASDGPALIELGLPSDPAMWRGIWLTQGFDEATTATGQRDSGSRPDTTGSCGPVRPADRPSSAGRRSR